MYDFIDFSQGTNFYLNLYCFLLYCALLLISLRGNLIKPYCQEQYKDRKKLLFCGLLLFALTSFVGGDFFHYYEYMSVYKNQVFNDQGDGLELFYQYLIYFIGGNYFLFRLIVWGVSLLLIVLSARKFGANVYNTLFIVLAGFIVTYSYARATLAMSVFWLGVVIICAGLEQKRRLLSIMLGLFVLVTSICFHRSMIAMIAIALCWLLLPWKKKISGYSLWLFPILVVVSSMALRSIFDEVFVMANTIEDETMTLDKAESYAEQEAVVRNVNGYIREIIHYSTFYLPWLLIANSFRSKDVVRKVGKRGVWLYQIVFLTLVFATSFLLLDIDGETLFYRYLYMSFIPLALLIAYMKKVEAITDTQYMAIITFLALNNLFQLSATVYGSI